MRSFSTLLLILVVLIAGFAGYYYLSEVVPMTAALQEAQQKNQELAFNVEQLEERNKTLAGQLEQKMQELSEEKNKEINKLKGTYEDLISGLKEQVEKGEVKITRLADQLSVQIVDRIIFPSGKAEVSAEGEVVLQRLGNILKETKDKRIRVEGHTDNVPIHKNLREEFPSNWELSAARATNVVRFLSEKVGINPANLEAVGLGEHKPIATNKTRRGRARNRRIEILLIPKPAIVQRLTRANHIR